MPKMPALLKTFALGDPRRSMTREIVVALVERRRAISPTSWRLCTSQPSAAHWFRPTSQAPGPTPARGWFGASSHRGRLNEFSASRRQPLLSFQGTTLWHAPPVLVDLAVTAVAPSEACNFGPCGLSAILKSPNGISASPSITAAIRGVLYPFAQRQRLSVAVCGCPILSLLVTPQRVE